MSAMQGLDIHLREQTWAEFPTIDIAGFHEDGTIVVNRDQPDAQRRAQILAIAADRDVVLG